MAVEALLHLVRVMEAAEAAERAHQQAREAELTLGRGWEREQARAAAQAVQAAYEQVMCWQDEIGRARADVLWQLGQGGQDWSSWLSRHTSIQGAPRASGAA